MTKLSNCTTSKTLSDHIVAGMIDKKAFNISILDLRELGNSVADFFVICTGNSNIQIKAIAESIEKTTWVKNSQKPWRMEGKTGMEWVIIDYIDVVAHIFTQEKRIFYGLDELWGDANVTKINQ